MNNKGFSLVEVLVAVGIMSVMSFFMMDMISNQNKAIKTTQLSMDINEAQNQLQRYLLDADICTSSLTGYNFPQNIEVPIDGIKRDPTTILLSKLPPSNKVGGVQIESLSVKRKWAPLDKELELFIRFKKTVSGTSYGGDLFLRKINLSAQFLTASPNMVKNCFSQLDRAIASAVQESCKQLCPTCTWDAVNVKCVRPTAGPAQPLFINPLNGQITPSSDFEINNDSDDFCTCYNPGCPAGSTQVRYWCNTGSGATRCGAWPIKGKTKIGYSTCRINNALGYLTPTPQ